MSFFPSCSHKPVLERTVMWHYFYLSIFFPSVFYLFVHKLGRFLNSTCECQWSECNATETKISCHLSNASLVLKVSNKFVKMWAAACTQNIQLGMDSDTCFRTKCCLFLQITQATKSATFKKSNRQKNVEQCISVTWQVLLLVGYRTAVKIQTNLNMSVCQWAGRAPLSWGKWGFGLTLCGKRWGFLSASVAHL